ncbi:MAG TPA: outer membrane beta-barrel protein [Xanthobacteraceae bacterium]|nr:outer membrane beta-barrel protein [Xanthobacteraceae bacterium]
MARLFVLRALALAGAVCLAGAGHAADLIRPAPLPPPVPIWTWTGFYAGVHGGGAWGDGHINDSAGKFDMSGGFAGGQIGYNYQMGSFLLGAEVDSAWASIGRSETFVVPPATLTAETEIGYLGTARLRGGYVQGPTLWYVTGGASWMQNIIRLTAALPPFVGTASSENTHVGWNIGGGLEWAFNPNWTLKAEYLYHSFDDETYFAGVAGGFRTDAQINTVKIGVNYLFH